ncbi:MAG: hypothetical protein COS99_02815 [Candidatus Omnitrophica bacterium CG07_land_8_20_14_0_80_42_15]|uniref:Exosortase n=1 Tax=Candidatus Aquitaenariimonas noxiae TaxID=1974741 RepID=A0A2J0KU35_9BACT|nr:MAG: hypothetical protein COS99_02815 [Candidatus Omnitrophica bacterium CG07_land_8_20_14_0_80_42_15]
MKRNELIKFGLLLALVIIVYIPTLAWMWDRWFAAESYYEHGFLIPLVSLYFVWQKRKEVKSVEWSSGQVGLAIIALSLLAHLACAVLRVYFVSGFLFVLALYGLVLFSFGKKLTRLLIFPILFLFMMVPLPLVAVGNLTVALKLFVTKASVFLLNHIGFPSLQDGSIIRMPKSYIMIEAPCSGLRSLISLLTLGLIFAYTMKASYIKKIILLILAFPIAMFTNIMRTTLIAMVNDLYGGKIAMGFFHDMTGFVMFGVAFACLYGASKGLSRE